jgi:YVTN family beta-propeller protein
VAVIDESGVPWPLTLHLPELTAGTVNRQRLFASGRLPVGRYRGISLVCKGAWLQTDEGEVALRVGSEPLEVSFRFVQPERGAGLLEMAYRHDDVVHEGLQFTPMLAVYPPARPLQDRVGIVNCGRAGYLTIFDRKTLEVHGVISTGGRLPGGVVIDDRQHRIYLAIDDDDLVEALDLVSGDLIGRMQLRPGDHPGSLALSPDGRLLLVACPGSDSVLFLDVLTQIELARVPVGEEPVFILPDRRNQRAYVFSKLAATVTVLDLVNQQVVATLPLDVGPFRGALSRDGSRLYVLHQGSPYLSVLDTRSLALLERRQVGLGGSVLLVDPRTDLLYLGRDGEKRLDVYSAFFLLPVDYLEGPGGPEDMVIADEENRLLLSLPGQAELAAIDLISGEVVGLLETGAVPHDLAVAGARFD